MACHRIRIEYDILVTTTGVEHFSAVVARTITEIEQWMTAK